MIGRNFKTSSLIPALITKAFNLQEGMTEFDAGAEQIVELQFETRGDLMAFTTALNLKEGKDFFRRLELENV